MLEDVTLQMMPPEKSPPCIWIGGDGRVTLRFKSNSCMLGERGYSYALVLPVKQALPPPSGERTKDAYSYDFYSTPAPEADV